MSRAVMTAIENHHDQVSAKFGMWLFLFTELLLFGGLFLLYSIYRVEFSKEFHDAAIEMDVFYGTFNTLLLITSSLTVALSLATMKRNSRKLSKLLILATIIMGALFLFNKYMEWSAKIHHGLFPGSQELMHREKGQALFFGLYYLMTGLHGLHVLIGVTIFSILLYFLSRDTSREYSLAYPGLDQLKGSSLVLKDDKEHKIWESEHLDEHLQKVNIVLRYAPSDEEPRIEDLIKLENSGLYWHFVDIIWIFLFPLFYLIT